MNQLVPITLVSLPTPIAAAGDTAPHVDLRATAAHIAAALGITVEDVFTQNRRLTRTVLPQANA